MLKGVFTPASKGKISLLESFNHLSRHSFWISDLANSPPSRRGTVNEPLWIATLMAPFAIALYKQSPALIATATAILGGFVGSKYVYKRLKEKRHLGSVWNAVSKIDMPMFLSGNLIMSGVYLWDTVSLFRGSASFVAAADPALLFVSAWAAYSAWPKIKDVPQPVLSLPAPKNTPNQ
jgi:hypothetical protein